MKEHPILFSTPMVQAILEGRKSQTRRVIKPQPENMDEKLWCSWKGLIIYGGIEHLENKCPYGQIGEVLWVRETFRVDACYDGRPVNGQQIPDGITVECKASPHSVYTDGNQHRKLTYDPGKWRPSIFMPRWASRITLEITDIRVQRVQEISHADITAEGFGDGYTEIGWNYVFGQAWNKINEKRGYGWNSNPFVWCLSFKLIRNK